MKKILFCFYLLSCTVNTAAAATIGKIAIIIDDMGYNRHNQSFAKLPTPVTFAILPFTPYSQKIANSAHQQEREVILHIPMQAQSHNHLLGKGALMVQMTKQNFQHVLSHGLADIPYAIGVNNHMGSKLTEEIIPMQWTMELLSKRGLFFVDSLTTSHSVAESSAVSAGLPSLRRHIFLDNVRTSAAMDKQFQQAIAHSLKAPYTIIIGHPYPETLQYLSRRLGAPNKDFQLVKLSQLITEEQRVMLENKKTQYQQTKKFSPLYPITNIEKIQ